MRWTNKTFVLLGAALVTSTLHAVPAANLKENYQSIIERNPFGLKPPPPPPTNVVEQVKEKPKVEIFLTGLTAVDFPRLPKQAYFFTREQGKKDPTYYTLNEGDGKDGIQVLDIDAQRRKVRIKMDNKETMLSFESHGVPVAAVSAKPGMPGVPGIPLPQPGQQVLPQPGAAPMPINPGRAMYDGNGQPVVDQNMAAAEAINQRYGTQGGQASTGLRQIPSRRLRGNQPGPGVTPPPMGGGGDMMQQPQGQPVDIAEDYLRMHLNRAAREQQGIPMPPVPTLQ